jgi:hypothetical protein
MYYPDAQLGGGTGELGVWPLAAIGLYSSLWMSWTVLWRGLAAISIRDRVMTTAATQQAHVSWSAFSTAMLNHFVFQMMGQRAFRRLHRNSRVDTTASRVARIVGLISGWPAAAAGARLDADAHDWPNRHGTREKRLDELVKQHHTNTVHMTDDHILTVTYTSSASRLLARGCTG